MTHDTPEPGLPPVPGADDRPPAPTPASGRLAELDELQRQIELRLKDNRRFLDHFLDEDEVETGEDPDGDGDEEPFEEL